MCTYAFPDYCHWPKRCLHAKCLQFLPKAADPLCQDQQAVGQQALGRIRAPWFWSAFSEALQAFLHLVQLLSNEIWTLLRDISGHLLLRFYAFGQVHAASTTWIPTVCICSESCRSTGAGNVKKGQKEQQGAGPGLNASSPLPWNKTGSRWFLLLRIAYSYRDRKRINEFCEENSETVRRHIWRTRGKWLCPSLSFCIHEVRWFLSL